MSISEKEMLPDSIKLSPKLSRVAEVKEAKTKLPFVFKSFEIPQRWKYELNYENKLKKNM